MTKPQSVNASFHSSTMPSVRLTSIVYLPTPVLVVRSLHDGVPPEEKTNQTSGLRSIHKDYLGSDYDILLLALIPG